ncbi:MAG: gamma-glutamyl-gamma-aminobutyrate hydrolase family protein [Chitinophagales bacterium]
MTALIGISCSYSHSRHTFQVRSSYIRAVERAGGVPVILPAVRSDYAVERYVEYCDGFILSGGGDLDPLLWGEEPHPGLGEVDPERDQFELALVQGLLQKNKPGLFICRGLQVLNVALGGDLIQDIVSDILHRQTAPRYSPSHEIQIEKESLLYSLLNNDSVRVNSFHHQAIRKLGNGLKITAYSRDGIVEAVELPGSSFILGVQWHPEDLRDEGSFRLFSRLVESAAGHECQNPEAAADVEY